MQKYKTKVAPCWPLPLPTYANDLT